MTNPESWWWGTCPPTPHDGQHGDEDDDDDDDDDDDVKVSRSDAWGVARSDALDVSRSDAFSLAAPNPSTHCHVSLAVFSACVLSKSILLLNTGNVHIHGCYLPSSFPQHSALLQGLDHTFGLSLLLWVTLSFLTIPILTRFATGGSKWNPMQSSQTEGWLAEPSITGKTRPPKKHRFRWQARWCASGCDNDGLGTVCQYQSCSNLCCQHKLLSFTATNASNPKFRKASPVCKTLQFYKCLHHFGRCCGRVTPTMRNANGHKYVPSACWQKTAARRIVDEIIKAWAGESHIIQSIMALIFIKFMNHSSMH